MSFPYLMARDVSRLKRETFIVEIPIQERRRITLASISEMMKRFGALETEPEWLSSSDKSVSVHFKSPISARAAVNTRNGSLLVRFADGTVSSGYKFGGQDASDPVSLIRSYLDRSLIREACDVAVETLERLSPCEMTTSSFLINHFGFPRHFLES